MIESTEQTTEEVDSQVLPTNAINRPSKTLLFAIFLLTTTIGIALSAGYFLWSLNDPQIHPETPTSTQSDN